MIYVLTQDRRAKSQLSLILRELGQKVTFCESIEQLAGTHDKQAHDGVILIDIHTTPRLENIERLREVFPECGLIGFESYSHAEGSQATKVAGLSHTFILPTHAERAKARIKSALKTSTLPRLNQARKSTPSKYTRSPFKRTATKLLNRPKTTSEPAIETHTSTRYITTFSHASIQLLANIRKLTQQTSAIILHSDTGAEFELVAREINYQSNKDLHGIHLLDSDSISIEALERLERVANKAKAPTLCYLGKIEDFTEDSMQVVQQFIVYLDHLRNPHLRLILAYENGCEYLLQNRVEEIYHSIQKSFSPLTIPCLSERTEDISAICLNTLSALRTAHPFLLVKSISDAAINYLIESRSTLNHDQLVRILRNSIALCQRSVIHPEDFKNYGESETTTQHLLESMADEQFFPASQAVNT